MTPATNQSSDLISTRVSYVLCSRAGGQGRGRPRTEGMPENEGELWDLLPLLAEFQESSLAGVFVEEVGNVGHGAAVVFGDVIMGRLLGVGGELVADRVVGVGGETTEVLLLLDRGGGGGGGLLLLGMGVVSTRLLVHPRLLRALGRELVVSVDVRRGHHHGRYLLRMDMR